MPSLWPYTEFEPRKGFGTRFSCIRSMRSRPFFMDHRRTSPSLPTETSSSGGCLSGPWSTHRVSQTMSVCFWSLCVDREEPLFSTGRSDSRRRSQIITDPSCVPAATMFGCTEEKWRAVTPCLVRMTRSGYVGFFSDQNSTRPPCMFGTGAVSPYETARRSWLWRFHSAHVTVMSCVSWGALKQKRSCSEGLPSDVSSRFGSSGISSARPSPSSTMLAPSAAVGVPAAGLPAPPASALPTAEVSAAAPPVVSSARSSSSFASSSSVG
mmetsp:Transcript_53228/g.150017  ORF Transcript_53228/g.150017 Transcript_53228/m.150017 type:complete len:267 (+) Transcript_53228:736-1536(+)